MIKNVLLSLGILLLVVHHCIVSIPMSIQFFLFLSGILLLGIPHGSADLLVAAKNNNLDIKAISSFKILGIYLARLILFAVILYFFTTAGIILFIVFAAYHFGETDLHQFDTHTFNGKLFVFSYGLAILSIILLHHFEEVQPILLLLHIQLNSEIIHWLDLYRYFLLFGSGLFFFIATFHYFYSRQHIPNRDTGNFLVRFAFILFIVFNLPLLLGFTFYFVGWHSILSINNIVLYLRSNKLISVKTITRQIFLCSVIPVLVVISFSCSSFFFINTNAGAGYVFICLAVLTAPHMEIMYKMYHNMRG